MTLATLFLLAIQAVAAPPHGPPPTEGVVASVYDGDTLTLASGDKVRLKWVNTPELKPAEPFGTEARDATRAFVLDHRVQLVFEGDEPRDGYGRIVAGVRAESGDLSLHLVERGLAHVFVIPPDHTDLSALYAAQARARAAHIGIWSTDRYQGALHITSFHANGSGDDAANPNVEYLRVCNVSDAPVDLSAYTVRNRAGLTFGLPAVTLPVGHTVKLISGKGTDQADPAQQIEVYLQSDGPVWDDAADTVTILDASGATVDSRKHEPASRSTGKKE